MSKLEQLAPLLARRNAVDKEIATLIDRPAIRGHIGEWIAQEIFKVKLEKSAAMRDSDGRFTCGPLAGKTVNVKWYGKREGMLNMKPGGFPDYYLVMTGEKAPTRSSRGQTRPLVIEEVFLFDAQALVEVVRKKKRSRRIGVATGVPQPEWEKARVYPSAGIGALLALTAAKREALKLFAETTAKRELPPTPKRPG